MTEPAAWMNLATAYELLSLGLLLPGRETAEALARGELAEVAEEVFAIPFSEFDGYAGDDAEAVFHAIRVEYTRLFVGEREPLITPYAGVKASMDKGNKGLLFVGAESMEIERFMKRCGMVKDLAAGQANDPMDHVGTMCEFLKYLALVNAQAIAAPEGTEIAEGEFSVFFTSHFETDASWCAGQLTALATEPFYRGMARALSCTCELSQSTR